VGRAAWGVAGEIERGTMELLLAQPIARFRVIAAHFVVDLVTIPLLCLSLFGGTWLGLWLFGQIEFGAPVDADGMRVDPLRFAPALANVAALLFAVSGYTMGLSAAGRSRGRVLGWAVLLTLLMFLLNLIGQLLPAIAFLRPLTVFYYFQPQQIILGNVWTQDLGNVWNGGRPLFAVNLVAVLGLVGAIGYGFALTIFCRRDLPAPL
jgi:ABC-2 type transport system permease protein